MSRVLILTADIGAGHDLPAASVAHEPQAHVVVADALRAAGRGAPVISRTRAETVLEPAPWLYDAEYWLIARFGPTRALGGRLAMALSVRGLRRLIDRERPEGFRARHWQRGRGAP